MKKLITEYEFTPSNRTVRFTGDLYPELLEQILLITNVSTGDIIYNFADPLKGGSLTDLTLTLEFDTTLMSQSHHLQIFFETTDAVNAVDLLIQIRQMLVALVYPPTLDKSSNRTRGTVILESGTVTTVTNVSNITSLDGYQAKLPVINQNLDTWANVVRRQIT